MKWNKTYDFYLFRGILLLAEITGLFLILTVHINVVRLDLHLGLDFIPTLIL